MYLLKYRFLFWRNLTEYMDSLLHEIIYFLPPVLMTHLIESGSHRTTSISHGPTRPFLIDPYLAVHS